MLKRVKNSYNCVAKYLNYPDVALIFTASLALLGITGVRIETFHVSIRMFCTDNAAMGQPIFGLFLLGNYFVNYDNSRKFDS